MGGLYGYILYVYYVYVHVMYLLNVLIYLSILIPDMNTTFSIIFY